MEGWIEVGWTVGWSDRYNADLIVLSPLFVVRDKPLLEGKFRLPVSKVASTRPIGEGRSIVLSSPPIYCLICSPPLETFSITL